MDRRASRDVKYVLMTLLSIITALKYSCNSCQMRHKMPFLIDINYV